MSATLPFQATCCETCTDPATVNIPGPAGAAGAAGDTGAAGQNAYTVTTADFVIPALEGSVTISVGNSSWCTTGQVLYIKDTGYFEVTNKPSSTQITIKNLETAGGAYADNDAPGGTVTAGAQVTPGGWQGTAGAVAGTVVGGDLTGTLPNPTLVNLTANGDLLTREAGANTRKALGTVKQVLHVNPAGGEIQWRTVDLTGSNTSITGAVPVANGGTNSTAAPGASLATCLNNLLPTGKAAGDIFYYNGAGLIRLAKGTSGQYLQIGASAPSWVTFTPGTSVKFKAILTTETTNYVPAGNQVVVFNSEASSATVEAFDPNTTYNTANGRWTPGVIGYAHIHASVTAYGTSVAGQPANITVWKYDSTSGNTFLVGTSDYSYIVWDLAGPDAIHAPLKVDAISQVVAVGDYFYVTISGPTAMVIMGSSTIPYTVFSGYTMA